MEKLKLLVLILVAIAIVSCNSINEPEVGDDIVIGTGVANEDPEVTNEDPEDINNNPITAPAEEPVEDPNADPIEEFNQAKLLLFYTGKGEEGLVAMYRLVEKYKNHEVGMRALRMIEAAFDITGRAGEVLAILEKYSQGDSKVAKFAYYRTSYRYLSLREYDKAIEIVKGFNVDDVDGFISGAARLYNLGTIYYDYIGNKEEGYKYFLELINTYPNSNQAATVMRFYNFNLR